VSVTTAPPSRQLWRYINEAYINYVGWAARMVKALCYCLALESGEGSAGGGDTLRDLPRVKKTLRQLLGDLKKVAQIAQMSA